MSTSRTAGPENPVTVTCGLPPAVKREGVARGREPTRVAEPEAVDVLDAERRAAADRGGDLHLVAGRRGGGRPGTGNVPCAARCPATGARRARCRSGAPRPGARPAVRVGRALQVDRERAVARRPRPGASRLNVLWPKVGVAADQERPEPVVGLGVGRDGRGREGVHLGRLRLGERAAGAGAAEPGPAPACMSMPARSAAGGRPCRGCRGCPGSRRRRRGRGPS